MVTGFDFNVVSALSSSLFLGGMSWLGAAMGRGRWTSGTYWAATPRDTRHSGIASQTASAPGCSRFCGARSEGDCPTGLNMIGTSGMCESLHQIAASMGRAIDAKDPSTSSHSLQVADLARCLALRAGMSYQEVDAIHVAGHLHDIGKIGIPDAVLGKRGPLDDAEWQMIRRHPEIGAEIVGPVHVMNGFTGITRMILHHHEQIGRAHV